MNQDTTTQTISGMRQYKRPFYIIGHNPNTIEEAQQYLEKGVNALEPDIVHVNGRYYVAHHEQLSYEGVPTVETYLANLKELLLTKNYDLALLVWDTKSIDFDPNDFLSVVKAHFSGGICDGVAMLLTNADDHEFVSRYDRKYPNVGIGVDESDVSPSELEAIFKRAGHENFSYADGVHSLLNKLGVFKNVMEAQRCREMHEPGSFKLVYTWVLSMGASIRKYLDHYVDGIMVDERTVRRMRKIILSAPYNEMYELAKNGYNPFTATPVPKYVLTIKTRDKLFAGTNAKLKFRLTGDTGNYIESNAFDGAGSGIRRGSIKHLTIEGVDLGRIKELTVIPMSDGAGAGWLPEKITVESKWLKSKLDFVFDSSEQENWIGLKAGPFTKAATTDLDV